MEGGAGGRIEPMVTRERAGFLAHLPLLGQPVRVLVERQDGGGMEPILKKPAVVGAAARGRSAVHQPVKIARSVGAEPAPQHKVVAPLHDVQRIDLDAADSGNDLKDGGGVWRRFRAQGARQVLGVQRQGARSREGIDLVGAGH